MDTTERTALTATGQGLANLVRAILTLIGAAVVGFGIPAGWLVVGGAIQSASAGGGTAFAAIAVVFCGIVGSYFVLIWAVGAVAAWRAGDETGRPRRYNWNRSLRDEAHRPPQLNWLESLFVTTAILVGVAYMVWFFFFAGSSLPAT
jgi:hypothetical protein